MECDPPSGKPRARSSVDVQRLDSRIATLRLGHDSPREGSARTYCYPRYLRPIVFSSKRLARGLGRLSRVATRKEP